MHQDAGEVRLGAGVVALVIVEDPLDGIGEFHRLPSWRGAHSIGVARSPLLLQNRASGENSAHRSTRWSASYPIRRQAETTLEPRCPCHRAACRSCPRRAVLASDADTVLAQGAQPSLPGAPQPTPEPSGRTAAAGRPGGRLRQLRRQRRGKRARRLSVGRGQRSARRRALRKDRRRQGFHLHEEAAALTAGAVEARHRSGLSGEPNWRELR